LLTQHLTDAQTQNMDLPSQRGRYARWLSSEYQKTTDPAEVQRELNRLRYALLTYANQIKV
jgi:hypothetical protein